ncbi:MAG: PASTA domain-containing protein [Bryocella sp.]
MKRFLRYATSAFAMLFVAILSAAITLRVAIHGHEVTVPNFSGMSVSEASSAALKAGVDLNIENKFYSTTVPAGRVLSQAPASGSRVRHGWQARVTLSLGPQQVTIPDVVGQPERAASINIRRNQLDLGTLAHIDAPGDPNIVLAQTPPSNAGVDQPRVSLLLSSSAGGESSSLVMPSFLGMSSSAAYRTAAAMGIRVASIGDTPAAPTAAPAAPAPPQYTVNSAGVRIDKNGAAVSFPAGSTPAEPSASAPAAAPVAPAAPAGPVTEQRPDSGYRIAKGDTVRLTFGYTNSTTAPSTPTPTTTVTTPATAPTH